MGLSVKSGHADQLLANVSVMYKNGVFVAERVLPRVYQDKQSAKYPVYGKENLVPEADLRRPGATSGRFEWSLSQNSNDCDGHALHAPIPDEFREGWDTPLNLDTDITIGLTDKMALNREVAVEALLDANLTTVDLAGAKWDDNDVDPMADLDSRKETIQKATGSKPNVLVLSRPVFRGVRNNAQVRARISGAQNIEASKITAAMLAEALEFEEVIVAEAVKQTAAGVGSYVWGNTAHMLVRPSTPGLRIIALGYMFTWNKGVLGAEVFKGRLPDLEHSDYIEVMRYEDYNIVAAAAGVRFENAVA